MLYIAIFSTAFTYICFYFFNIVPIGDSFQLAGNQYYFLNEMIEKGVLAKWMPFMTHGTISNIWYSACVSFSFPILYFLGELFTPNYLFLYYLSSFIDELIFLVGMYLLTKKLYRDNIIRVFVCFSSFLTIITCEQIHFNLKFFQLTPFMLYLMISFFEERILSKLILSLCITLISIFGTLPYFLPINLFFFTTSFIILCFVYKIQITKLLNRNSIASKELFFSIIFLALILLVLYLLNTTGLNEVSFFNVGRDTQGKVSLDSFLSYGGSHSLYKYLELFTGLSINFELQFFSGFLVTFYSVLAFFNYNRLKSEKYFLFFLSLLIINLLISQNSPLTKIVYFVFPLMNYYRHTAFLSVFLKVFLVLFSGFGLQYYLKNCYQNKKLFNQLLYPAIISIFLLTLDIIAILLKNKSILILNYRIWDLITIPDTINAIALSSILSLELFYIGVLGLFIVLFYLNYKKLAQNKHYLIYLSLFSLVVYKVAFSRFASIPVNDNTTKTFNFYSYQYPTQRIQNYLSNTRYKKWHSYLYVPKSTPKFDGIDKQHVTYPGTFEVGRMAALYWSFESFLHLDACMTIYRTDHMTQYTREFNNYYGLYQTTEGRTWEPKIISEEYLKRSGCYYDKIQFFLTKDFSQEPIPLDYMILKFDSNNLIIKLLNKSSQKGLLYYADSWHSFWKATVDGKNQNILVANKAYKAVEANSNSIIHFEFKNNWLDFSQIIYLVLCLALLALIAWEWIKKANIKILIDKKTQIK